MKYLAGLLFGSALLVASAVHAAVYVSPVMAIDPVRQNIDVPPGRYVAIALPGENQNDEYKVTVSVGNAIYKDISASLVDEANLQLFQQNARYSGKGYQRTATPFSIQGSIQSAGKHFLILDNQYAGFITKKVSITIEAQLKLDQAAQENLERAFSNMYAGLKQQLIFPDFNIRIEPCGQVNAYSETFGSGDIHYCTEMISHVFKTNNKGAFAAIFLHEVGHTLLGLWGIPGNNNEDIADEFSTYMLMSSGPSGYALLDRSLEFWANRDSAAEAQNMLRNGDRHSLSIQRLRNIKENMQRAESFIQRWNKLVYEHTTTEALSKAVSNPQHGDDVELARTIIDQRNKLGSLSTQSKQPTQ